MADEESVPSPPGVEASAAASSSSISEPTEDFSAIERHSIVSLGGTDHQGRPVVLFYACRLPPTDETDQQQLLRYLKHTLDQYVESDYTIVYFHHGLRSASRPSFSWLIAAYRELDRKYKKNLKRLLIVHPSTIVRLVMGVFKPVISYKFGRKISNMSCIAELGSVVFVQQLEIPPEVLEYDKTLKPRPAAPASVKKEPSLTQQFGVALETIAERNGGEPIGAVVRTCVDYIRLHGLNTVGVLRRSGNKMDAVAVQDVFNGGEIPELSDVHLASGLLKQFFRELPQPVLTFDLYKRARQMMSMPSGERLLTCRSMIDELPAQNRRLLSFLVEFLVEIVSYSEKNKMTSQNVAIVFGPNLLWSDSEAASVDAMNEINFFTCFMLDHYREVGLEFVEGQVENISEGAVEDDQDAEGVIANPAADFDEDST